VAIFPSFNFARLSKKQNFLKTQFSNFILAMVALDSIHNLEHANIKKQQPTDNFMTRAGQILWQTRAVGGSLHERCVQRHSWATTNFKGLVYVKLSIA
jgi:hypothetical protein